MSGTSIIAQFSMPREVSGQSHWRECALRMPLESRDCTFFTRDRSNTDDQCPKLSKPTLILARKHENNAFKEAVL